jgi:hypothetical protein
VLRNDGGGRFAFCPFPALAQTSAGFGVVLEDLDGDGSLDIALAQNFYHPQLETGAVDGGIGLVLRGDGAGGFAPLPATASGIVVPQDARSLVRVDVDSDGAPDLVFGVNGGDPQVFLSRRGGGARVRLEGRGANRDAIGARVIVNYQDGSRQACELAAGSGYLSQGPPELRLPSTGVKSLSIRWPDGRESEHQWEGASNVIIVRQP